MVSYKMIRTCVQIAPVVPCIRWRPIPKLRLRAGRDPEFSPSEKLISVSDVIKEAAELGEDFVFTDDSNEPVFKFEDRLQAQPEERAEDDEKKTQSPLADGTVDVTSAYAPEQGFKEMTVDELKSRLEAKSIDLLLDVRGPDEFAEGHVPGARNAPLTELNSAYVNNSDLKDYKEKRVAVICGIGKRSAQATVRLSKVLGFTDVTNVALGTKEWIEKGYETKQQ